jgi:hypothetical protein
MHAPSIPASLTLPWAQRYEATEALHDGWNLRSTTVNAGVGHHRRTLVGARMNYGQTQGPILGVCPDRNAGRFKGLVPAITLSVSLGVLLVALFVLLSVVLPGGSSHVAYPWVAVFAALSVVSSAALGVILHRVKHGFPSTTARPILRVANQVLLWSYMAIFAWLVIIHPSEAHYLLAAVPAIWLPLMLGESFGRRLKPPVER